MGERTAGLQSVIARLTALGLVDTNAERWYEAMKKVWYAACDMDTSQLRAAQDSDVGRAFLILATAFGIYDNGSTRGNNISFWAIPGGYPIPMLVEDGSLDETAKTFLCAEHEEWETEEEHFSKPIGA